uniref:putative T6SS immunity periplasmic lipoprotein n=1 Tax=Scandinavium goeteborgense TaxID=1851514 RepID=UPI0013584DC5|nr:putative T6SS immunity periplasmic lipoprotein [Scandinavium goeteborgense]
MVDFFSALYLPLVTGCPGRGDRLEPDELAKVIVANDRLCFFVPDTDDYQLSAVSISPRGAKVGEWKYIFGTDLKLVDDKLCIPPEYNLIERAGQYVVRYILTSKNSESRARKIIAGFKVEEDIIREMKLNDKNALL